MCRFVLLPVLVSVLFLSASSVLAGDLELELETYRVISDLQGEEHLEATQTARPGDTLEYRAIYENRGASTLRGIRGVLPIPLGTIYVAGSADPVAAAASLDGEHYAALPLRRKIPGTQRWEEVPIAEYRFVRFDLGDLTAHESATATARVTIPLRTASAD